MIMDLPSALTAVRDDAKERGGTKRLMLAGAALAAKMNLRSSHKYPRSPSFSSRRSARHRSSQRARRNEKPAWMRGLIAKYRRIGTIAHRPGPRSHVP